MQAAGLDERRDGRVTSAKQQANDNTAEKLNGQLISVYLATQPSLCKTVGSAYVGSNPTPATTSKNSP